MDPFLVYDNSRILTNMLRTVSKEGEDVVLELPGKMIVDVVTLLKFLKNPLADLSKFFYYYFPFDFYSCLLYTSPSPRDGLLSRMPSSA